MDASTPTIGASLAAIAVALGLLAKAAQAALSYWRRKGEEAAARATRKAASVPRVAKLRTRQDGLTLEFRNALGAHRALLIQVSNGGRVPTPGSQLRITVLADADTPHVSRVIDDYQQRPLTDPDYLRIVGELEDQDMLRLVTAELAPGSMLRDEYEMNQLVMSWVAVVLRTPERLYFLSASCRHMLPDDATTRTLLRAYSDRMRRLVERDMTRTVDDT